MSIELNKLRDAKQHYIELLRKHPNNPDLLSQLGAIYRHLNMYSDALKCYRKVVKIDPDSVSGYMCIAQLQLIIGKQDQAISSLYRVLEINPDYPQAAITIAQLRESQANLVEAKKYYQIALKIHPDLIAALLGMGRTLDAAGQYNQADDYFKRALNIDPGNIQALTLLGALSFKVGALHQAIVYYKHAIKCHPNSAYAYYHLARTQSVLGHDEESLVNYKKSSVLDPNFSDAIGGEASIYAMRGEYEKAYLCIRPCLDNLVASVHVAVVYGDICEKLQICDQAIKYIAMVLDRQDITYDSRVALRHMLGKLYDACGKYDNAFYEYRKANSMQPRGPDPQKQESYINKIITVWNDRFYATSPRARNTVKLPVFVIGMPRSGTTLVEQILASHPLVYGGGELHFMQNLLAGLPGILGSIQPYPDCISGNLTQEVIDILADRYLLQLRQLSSEEPFITDKMWANFEHLGLISLLFPKAKIINCTRNPLDTCLSIYFQYFSGRLPFANDLKHIALYYRGYKKLMDHWIGLLDIPILDVNYEDLVGHQESVTRTIVSFCGLPWDDQCLNFYHTRRITRTVSQEQVHKPIYQASVGRWKNYEKHISSLKEIFDEQAL